MKSGVKVVKDRTKEVKKALDELLKNRVYVGIPEDTSARKETDEPNNATLGYIHDKGSPARNIPARTWLEPGVALIKDRVAAIYRRAGELALSGNLAAIKKAHDMVGLVAQAGVRQKINQGPFLPLKASTLAARRAKGRTGTKPLIDTTQLRTAVNYVIRRFKGKK